LFLELTSEKLAELCAKYIAEKKGNDILVMDMREITSIVDFFVICTALSDTHARGLSGDVKEKLKYEHEDDVWHVEGYDSGRWILMDYVSIVVHIFQAEQRDYYSLERLWGDAKMKYWSEEQEGLIEND